MLLVVFHLLIERQPLSPPLWFPLPAGSLFPEFLLTPQNRCAVLCCCVHVAWQYSWGDMSQNLLALCRESMTNQSRAQLGELGCGVTYWNMGEDLLTGAEMSQRQLNHQKSIPAWVAVRDRWIPGAWRTTYTHLNRSKSILSRHLSWLDSLLAVQLVWQWFPSVFLAFIQLGMEGSSESQFQVLPESLSCWLPKLK